MNKHTEDRIFAFPSLTQLLLAVMLSVAQLPAQAGVDIAQQPLSVGEPVPPNIMFIMDDSGSMGWQHMPGTTAAWYDAPPKGLPYSSDLVRDIRLRASNVNSQWYNPLITYLPWKNHDGSSWGNINPRSAPWDPSSTVSTGNFDLGSTSWPTPTLNLSTTSVTEGSAGWRYRGFYVLNSSADPTKDQNYVRYEFRLDSGNWQARKITLKTDGTNNATSALTQFDWSSHGGSVRTINEEIQNIANWFSYYRLRASMAKGAASRVFADLDQGYRVGYNTLWNRQNFNIPVANNNGLFSGTNKEEWFKRLFLTIANNGTPLRQALGRAGEYFKDTAATGPYGPETGSTQLSCRQNFSIMTTDGYWNSNQADSSDARKNNDGIDGTEVSGPDGKKYTYIAETPYTDSRTNTLADVAMHYWKTDLTNLTNDVPMTVKNPAFWQHMRTFGVSIGEKGELDPKTDLAALTAGTKSWPEPGDDRQANIDDLWHAAVNSRGEFIVASNPEEFTSALTNTLEEIKNETKSSASGGTSSARLIDGTRAFFSEYTSGSWNGNIHAYPIDINTGLQGSTPEWSAESKLPVWSDRKIYVNKDGAAVAFTYANLSASQQTILDSAAVVNYLRGERSNEKPTGALRQRVGVLPGFINSQNVHVGAPSQTPYFGTATFTGASAYKDYATANKDRTSLIYVGGNGGMLHAFDASTGVEVYAFMPNSAITQALKTYTDPKYGLNDSADSDWETYKHRYFVDGELTVADVYLSGSWKTVLVGTLGRGGKGVFALDITDPANIQFLWEKSATDIPALGNNIGKPIVVQVADQDWRVLLGNGPNSTGDKAQLVMLAVADGAATIVDTGVAGNNGLAGVNAWDADKDKLFETAYAGDLKGNIWRFRNLGGVSPSVEKLFTTKNNRPITSMPLVLTNQKTGTTWVYVGTGQNLNKTDQTNMDTQSWYGLIDDGSVIASSSNLVQRKILSAGNLGARTARTLESGTEGEITNNSKRGWFIDFDLVSTKGERMITPNTLLGGALFGTTFIPDGSNLCSPDGTSSIWAINPFSGGRLNQGIFDINADGSINVSDKLGAIFPSALDSLPPITSGQPPITIGKDGKFSIHLPGVSIPGKLPMGELGRLSWREIIGR